MSFSSIPTTLPEVFNNSSLPSCTKFDGDTYPLIVSRSILRTITFFVVEGMLRLRAYRTRVSAPCLKAILALFLRNRWWLVLPCSQKVNYVIFCDACHRRSKQV